MAYSIKVGCFGLVIIYLKYMTSKRINTLNITNFKNLNYRIDSALFEYNIKKIIVLFSNGHK